MLWSWADMQATGSQLPEVGPGGTTDSNTVPPSKPLNFSKAHRDLLHVELRGRPMKVGGRALGVHARHLYPGHGTLHLGTWVLSNSRLQMKSQVRSGWLRGLQWLPAGTRQSRHQGWLACCSRWASR